MIKYRVELYEDYFDLYMPNGDLIATFNTRVFLNKMADALEKAEQEDFTLQEFEI